MATGQPKTKAEELGERIAALAIQAKPSQFAIRALRRDAEQLRREFPIEAADALGFLASLEGNVSEMRRNYEFALERRPRDFWIHSNYGNALLRSDLFSEARHHMLQAIEADPSHLTTLSAAAEVCIWTGWIRFARELVERYNKLSPDQLSELTDTVFDAANHIQVHDLEDKDIEALIDTAIGVMHSAKVTAESIRQRVLSDGESTWLSYHLSLAEPVELVVDLNVALAEQLALQVPRLRADEFVTVMFVSGAPS